MMKWYCAFMCLLSTITVESTFADERCYVNVEAKAPQDGTSWATAYVDLQSALLNPDCTMIWVAKGIYKPTSAIDLSVSFVVKPGVSLIGGFAGNETSMESANPAINLTVLSGDLGGTAGMNSDHVVWLDGASGKPITNTTEVSGFVITGGLAFGKNPDGGGLYCNGSGPGSGCSPRLANLVFSHNSSQNAGGAIFNDGSNKGESSPTIANSIFDTNYAAVGGAIYNNGAFGGSSNPTIIATTFIGNAAVIDGGALYNDGSFGGDSSPTIVNDTFADPFSRTDIYNLGSGKGSNSSPLFANTTIFNGAYFAAIFNDGEDGGKSTPTLTNMILWNESAAYDIRNSSASPTIDHSIVKGGCPDIGSLCTNIVYVNPQLGALGYHGGFTPTMVPGNGSPAIDGGSNADCPFLDQRGLSRADGHCDIGAVEWRQADDIIFQNGFQ